MRRLRPEIAGIITGFDYWGDMSETADRNQVPPPGGRLNAAMAIKAALSRPKWLAVACVVALAGLGWPYLGVLVSGMGGAPSTLGPGIGLVDTLPRAVVLLCRPTSGVVLRTEGARGAGGFVPVALMWSAMAFAMMLPSPGSMNLTYAEIAETAAAKGECIISPLILAGGYLVIWLGFAALATFAQFGFSRLSLLDKGMASVSALLSGVIFIASGAYQFSAFKHACLHQCQNRFPFFFFHWQTTAHGVFRLDREQGLFCVGYCRAMMFAVGVALIAVGIMLVAPSLAAHWPHTRI